MRSSFFALASAVLLAGALPARAPAEPAPVINCDVAQRRDQDYRPITAGPFVLAEVYCPASQPGPSSLSGSASVSPDGRSVALSDNLYGGLWTAAPEKNFRWTRVEGEPGSRHPFSDDMGARWAFAWRSDSRALDGDVG